MEQGTINVYSCNKAAFLLVNGIEYISTQTDDEGKAYFVFPINDYVQEKLNQYYKPSSTANIAIFNFLRQYWLVREVMRSELKLR